ncbi:MAG TPA: hypothetical protein VK935_04075, partial [Actinomycetospora sp.]|nr:hypothetical protein [Actinomycetospora sp.]
SFDRRVDGTRSYPDGTPCARLRPLPWRRPDPADDEHPGFPWFIDAGFPQKAPPPPAKIDAHVQGRRRYLGLERASAREDAAFAPGAETRPGAPFVALDTGADAWNEAAGLPPRRLLSFDVEVTEEHIDYNSIGWHDLNGHFYRLVGVAVDGVDNTEELTPARHEPFFPRANHGDVVELRLHNLLTTLPADHFDPTQLPVECGLHVHLVKFDVLAADGSSTGWNYLSGASCLEAVPGVHSPARPANVSLHRWVVDEEFGPCFFHDHLLANYRQKHGLFAALIAEPFGSEWEPAAPLTRALAPAPLRPAAAPVPKEPKKVAWAGASAVIRPPEASGITDYREACLGLGDFVPLHDRAGQPLNPPSDLGGDDDPGVMAVNYRNAPLTARGPDPSRWFATDEGLRARQEEPEPGDEDELERAGWLRDPETPIIETHPGERLRVRLIQGSHEEQHSFVAHGLRWRREWHKAASTLVNQQTLGISEAFTLDLDPQKGSAYGLGDHLWRFSAMDDLWLGCWGLVRSLPRDVGSAPLHQGAPEVTYPPERSREPRRYTIRARRVEHEYDADRLTDPWGLVYEVVAPDGATVLEEGPEYDWRVGTWPVSPDDAPEWGDGRPQPLVLRCLPGEWVRVRLINEVRLPRDDREAVVPDWPESAFEDPYLPRFGPEPHPPALPLDEEHRTVSDRVSLHPALLQYDVRTDDGAYVGTNRDTTIRALPVEETDHGHGGDSGEVVHREGHGHERQNWRDYWWYADPALGGETGQVCYLHDMADIRNHRHHGLVGAIVVEPAESQPEHWTGTHTVIELKGGERVDEQVLFWQDGLRHYLRGNPDAPVPDVVPGDDAEDAGQKGINYRCALPPVRDPLADERPPTPIWEAPTGRRLWLRLVGACDKPRNHTFTVHGRQWRVAPWLDGNSPETGGLSGLTADTVHDLDLDAVEHAGDHAYRSGVFRWAVTQGMWGILRVEDTRQGDPS